MQDISILKNFSRKLLIKVHPVHTNSNRKGGVKFLIYAVFVRFYFTQKREGPMKKKMK